MIVRDASVQDFAAIGRIHAAVGMDYRPPDLSSPLFLVRKVVEDGGNIVGAGLLRISSEIYLLLDPALRPRAKMTAMQSLQPEVLHAAWAAGIDEVEARIPETIERRFEKRLTQLGWSRNRAGWHPWTRQTVIE